MNRLLPWLLLPTVLGCSGPAPDDEQLRDPLTPALHELPPPGEALPVALDICLPEELSAQGFEVTVSGAEAGERIYLVRGGDQGAGPCIGALGDQCLAVSAPVGLQDRGGTNGRGVATFDVAFPAGMLQSTVGLQAVAIRGAAGADSVSSPAIAGIVTTAPPGDSRCHCAFDADQDGICDAEDRCFGDDAAGDSDRDGTCDDLDPCPDDRRDDSDGDGACDSDDPCPDDPLDDSDGDGLCDSDDPCPLDDPDDSDGDGSCDSDDPCPGIDDGLDADGDGVPDGCDLDTTSGLDSSAFSASSTWSGSSPAYAFDDQLDYSGSQYLKWHSARSEPFAVQWLQVDYGAGNAQQIEYFCLLQQASYATSEWSLQGSDDGTTWTTVYEVDDDPLGHEWYCRDFVNPDAWRYYRFAGAGGASNHWLIIEAMLLTSCVTADTDGDGFCDAGDPCPDDATDADGDGFCDAIDTCPGNDAPGDPDGDGLCGEMDLCLGDDAVGDTDADGVCDDLDQCEGDDAAGDLDADLICDDIDACVGDDTLGDADGDRVCDDLDRCPDFDDSIDSDDNGIPDLCDDATADLDDSAFSAYSTYPGSSPAWAFDDTFHYSASVANKWHSGDAGPFAEKWLQVDFGAGNEKAITYFCMTQIDADGTPAYALEASEDGGAWTTIHEVDDDPLGNAEYCATFVNDTAYRYWRVKGTTTDSDWWLIIELELSERCPASDLDGDGVCDLLDPCPLDPLDIDADGDGQPDLCQDLTDALADSAFTAYSTYAGSSPAWAFDEAYDYGGSVASKWHSGDAGSHADKWLQVDLGAGNTQVAREVCLSQSAAYSTPEWVLEGSGDSSAWTQLLHVTDDPLGNEHHCFDLEQFGAWRYYRLRGVGGSGWWLVVEMELFP